MDDEPFNIVGLKLRLKSLRKFDGLRKLVETANDGQQAVDIVDAGLENGITYCLIFMDLSMPIMDGFEATEVIRDLYEG